MENTLTVHVNFILFEEFIEVVTFGKPKGQVLAQAIEMAQNYIMRKRIERTKYLFSSRKREEM